MIPVLRRASLVAPHLVSQAPVGLAVELLFRTPCSLLVFTFLRERTPYATSDIPALLELGVGMQGGIWLYPAWYLLVDACTEYIVLSLVSASRKT